jgi:hypothetical protein
MHKKDFDLLRVANTQLARCRLPATTALSKTPAAACLLRLFLLSVFLLQQGNYTPNSKNIGGNLG